MTSTPAPADCPAQAPGATGAATAGAAVARPAPPPLSDAQRARQAWLNTLALADAQQLHQLARPWLEGQHFERLRGPEAGLALVRARVGGEGERFNLGEVTLSRCVLRHRTPEGRWLAGVGHVLGRDLARAETIARLDALLQRADLAAGLQHRLVAPLAAEIAQRQHAERSATEATRVAFYTLQADATA